MRPEGWKEKVLAIVYCQVSPQIYSEDEMKIRQKWLLKGIEIGADAYEEGLKKEALYHFTDEDSTFWPMYGKVEGLGKGYLVFIEEG